MTNHNIFCKLGHRFLKVIGLLEEVFLGHTEYVLWRCTANVYVLGDCFR